MGWENREGGTYYYTAKRVGGRVVKQYVGTGRMAELTAELADAERAEVARLAAAHKQEVDALAALDAALVPLYELADAATAAALVATGCHRPNRGKWRKRRG